MVVTANVHVLQMNNPCIGTVNSLKVLSLCSFLATIARSKDVRDKSRSKCWQWCSRWWRWWEARDVVSNTCWLRFIFRTICMHLCLSQNYKVFLAVCHCIPQVVKKLWQIFVLCQWKKPRMTGAQLAQKIAATLSKHLPELSGELLDFAGVVQVRQCDNDRTHIPLESILEGELCYYSRWQD